jgi:hypothetical protein
VLFFEHGNETFGFVKGEVSIVEEQPLAFKEGLFHGIIYRIFYAYIYICVCVCVCVLVSMYFTSSVRHVLYLGNYCK